ncbi:Cullin-domain-containing protein [Cantharellus anzutake]|uniref:Cullin-domain-containing protein n=1 Tax=Cantharellus anzutake TaxID=1750568 RepID=UPI0019066ACD|nr:Cullin-domain-containing protein [Cantharellus anzutake]KAF8340363.1 Cullin-domain-containing protein [Cantharellus anzutake]
MSAPARRGKGRIRPPPRRTSGADQSKLDTWTLLSGAIREILNGNASHLSFEENYRYAYNMVLHKQGSTLYEGVKELLMENLDKLAKEVIVPTFPSSNERDPVQQTQEGEMLLKAFRKVWNDHKMSMQKLRDLLKYMDRVYIQSAQVPMIWDAGMQLFLDRIIRSPLYAVHRHMLSTLQQQIRLERDGYPVNRSAIKGSIDVYRELIDGGLNVTVFKKEMEPPILEESETYYKREGEQLLDTCDAPEFLRRVEGRLESERVRASYYLSTIEAPLRSILERTLIAPHVEAVLSMLGSGLDNMINLHQDDNIARLFRLFVMVPAGPPALKKSLKDSIAERGRHLNEAEMLEGDMEEGDGDAGEDEPASRGKGRKPRPGNAPLAGKKRLDAALKWVSDVLEGIQVAMNEAFESFINSNPKAPEYISLFIDENLKKGLKGKTDEEVDTVLDKTITVFRFVTDKDVFERYYKTHLAKRLLGGRSVSDDAERGMLAKLKIECGFQFTQKLEGMFHDMKISNDTMEAYREHLGKSIALPPPIELSVQVLTSTFWPMSHDATACKFANDMVFSCKMFERFYLSRHSGRRLSWQPSLGNADLKVTFKSRRHDLNVSTYALIVLLLFEEVTPEEHLSFEDIKDSASIPDAELRRTLQSLACAKFKILKKHPPGRDVMSDDTFSFNLDFTCSLQRIKIGTVASKIETNDQRQETIDRVDEERKFQMEACIVRIMKDRKRMSHNDLINEVTRQLSHRFSPNPLGIKKRIEALLDRDYLDRGEDKKSYIYLA